MITNMQTNSSQKEGERHLSNNEKVNMILFLICSLRINYAESSNITRKLKSV